VERVTDKWLAESPLEPLTGAEGAAERLVLLLHHGVDFDIWGGARRVRYWDALSERVKAATYAGPTLSHWWGDACRQIVSSPRDHEAREEVATLLASGDAKAILNALRTHAEVLVLRTRVVSEYRRQARTGESA